LCGLAVADEGDDMGRRVQLLLRAHQNEVYACVAAEKVPPRGEMLVRVFIDEEHRVGRVDVLKQTTNSTTLSRCLSDRIRSWDVMALGASPGDQIVFPLTLLPRPKLNTYLDTLDGKPHPLPAQPQYGVFVVSGNPEVSLGTGEVFEKLAPGDLVWLPNKSGATLSGKARVLTITSDDTTPGTARIIRGAAVKNWSILGGAGTVKLYFDDTTPIAIDVLEAAHTTVSPHKHDTSDEFILVLDGKCDTTVNGKTTHLSAQQSLTIPSGVEHSMRVDGKVTVLQIYSPAGPEQRFKK
jgi:hypothetical protein